MLNALIEALHVSRGLQHKRDAALVVRALGSDVMDSPELQAPVGDDCAAIVDGDEFLLFAIEGFINEFVANDPWYAGWCGVMANVSDISAMGGRPVAVVDAIWDRNDEAMRPVLRGLADAARAYGVPIVGGHSNARCDRAQLAVSIVGRAQSLLSSFDARVGDELIVAIDLRGAYRALYSHWNAATGVDARRLRADLDVLPQLAEAGLCRAAKDISQTGIIGTAMMLLECSGVGAVIDIDSIPRPAGVELQRWLVSTFPSFGFVLAVAPHNVDAVLAKFTARNITAATVGRCDESRRLRLRYAGAEKQAWNFAEHDILGCAPSSIPSRSMALLA